jgi:phage RecT family recombinase
MATELAQKTDELQDWFTQHEERLARVAGNTLSPERAVQMLIELGATNPRVLKCRKITLWRCVQVALETELPIGGANGQLWILPFKNSKLSAQSGREQIDAVPVIGYKGYVTMMGRGDNPAVVSPHLVYEGEPFEYDAGGGHEGSQQIRHRPDIFMRRGIIKRLGDGATVAAVANEMNQRLVAAYSTATFANGLGSTYLMDRVQLDEAHQNSPGKNAADSPWRDPKAIEWMWKKTVVTKHCKYLPLGDNRTAVRAAQIDDHLENTASDSAMDQMGMLGFDDPEDVPNA